MQVESIAECSKHSAILSTFIKLLFAIKTVDFFLFFKWPFKTGFTVLPKEEVQEEERTQQHRNISILSGTV